MTCQSSCQRSTANRRFDRRVILKASASFAAMAALAGVAGRTVRAQDNAGETLGGKWVEEESIGAFSIASNARSFQADFAFFAIAPHWGGDGDPSAIVEMRFSADGDAWSDPVTVGVANDDAGQSDRDGRNFGRLVVLESGASYVQYRPVGADGAPTSLPSLAFTYIDASDGPSIEDVFAASTVEPTVERPPIISRAGWGANERYRHEDQKLSKPIAWPPEYQTVEHVIIHHSATPNFQDPLRTVRSIYYYHAVERDWGDIGYNYLVDWQGNVYEGRFGGDNVIGGHAYQYARGSSGICTIGNFMDEEPTAEARAALIWITAWVGRNIDPWGTADFHEQQEMPAIASHRDCFPRELCPGDMLYADLDYIRGAVAQVLSYQTDPGSGAAFSDGDEVTITYDGTNLRSGPGIDFSILRELPWGSYFLVNDGPINSDDYNWYKITGDLGLGWCVESNLELIPGSTPAKFVRGDSVLVVSDGVRMRASAGLYSSVIARMSTGDDGTVLDGPDFADNYFWYRIETAKGIGWCASDFLVAGRFSPGDDVRVIDGELNLRSGPGLGEGIVAVMADGALLSISGGPSSVDGYRWYEVTSARYGDGWCVGRYLTPA